MILITILLGIAGLGIVVLVHELGHYIAAKSLGVDVEAFSIGWGPKIFSFHWKNTEWKLSAFPLGGYCRMKGEESFRKAIEQKITLAEIEKNSFYSVSPFRRIIILLSGPVANVIFAFLIFLLVSFLPYSFPTFSNKIVLQSDLDKHASFQPSPIPVYPSDTMGLKSGDVITAIQGKKITDFSDIQKSIITSSNKSLVFTVKRNGTTLDLKGKPIMEKNGAGRIGITFWATPKISQIDKGSAAEIAGLQNQDLIVAINNNPIEHSAEFFAILNNKKLEKFNISVLRTNNILVLPVIVSWDSHGVSNLGIQFQNQIHYVTPAANLLAGISFASGEVATTIASTVKGIGSLFLGVNPLQAISGPARITFLVGETAREGIANSASGGLAIPLNFLGFLSLALFIMNLLPIPALDGGQIILNIIEWIRRKPIKPINIYRYQFIGVVFIFGIFIFATIGDVIFFAGK